MAKAFTFSAPVRNMLEGSELAALGITHKVAPNVTDVSSIKKGDKAGVMALASKLGAEVSDTAALSGSTKVRALVGVALAVKAAGLDITAKTGKDASFAEELTKLYSPNGVANVNASYLRGAWRAAVGGYLEEVLDAYKASYDGANGKRKPFENGFYAVISAANSVKGVPAANVLAEKIAVPVQTDEEKAAAKAKKDAAKLAAGGKVEAPAPVEITLDEMLAQIAKAVAAETANLDDKEMPELIKSLAGQIKAARDEIRKAKPTSAADVVTKGKKKKAA